MLLTFPVSCQPPGTVQFQRQVNGVVAPVAPKHLKYVGLLFASSFHSLARKATSCSPAEKHGASLLWGAACRGIYWQSDRGSPNRKYLAWDTPHTLCEVLLMPNYTSGLLEAKPNTLLGFVFLTLSSHEPCWLLNHHLPPVRADFLSLLLQRPKSCRQQGMSPPRWAESTTRFMLSCP